MFQKHNPHFITFEGGEGAGKTTLMTRLQDYLLLQGIAVFATREPGGTPLGNAVRELLLNKHTSIPVNTHAELFLFLASRAAHVEDLIKPELKKGTVVLCDRFNDSTVAYQGYARGLGMDRVRALCNEAALGLHPDLTFYLDLPPDVGFQRMHTARREQDRMEDEEIGFHLKVREGFLKIAEQEPGRVKILDARQPPDQVFEQMLSYLNVKV